jgi:uncharacterized protein YkwD
MAMRAALVFFLAALGACGPRADKAADPSSSSSGDVVEQKVVVEKLPDGSTRKTTITTTKRTVEAPPPPPRPADPWPGDPLVKYNVDRINAFRAQHGLAPLLYDASISAFAKKGSERLASDHAPHANFHDNAQGAPGFGSRSAENQGDPGGVPTMDPDPGANGRKQIDVMMKLMIDEGPGGGHHDNMLNPRFRRVGVGLVYVGGKLYLTNDFSD